MNFSQLGVNSLKEQSAFKKIQFFSKTNPADLFNAKSDFEFSYNKVTSLYNNDLSLQNSSSYGTVRQHNTSSLKSTINSANSLLDTKSFNNYLAYTNSVKSSEGSTRNNETLLNFGNLFQQYNLDKTSTSRTKSNNFPQKTSLIGEKGGSKQFANPFKYLINPKISKKVVKKLVKPLTAPVFNKTLPTFNSALSEFSFIKPSSTSVLSMTNFFTENKFVDSKSNDLQLLPGERNARLLSKVHSSKNNHNLNNSQNNLTFFRNLNTSLESLFNNSTCF
jgi:hypothetical protein